MTISLSLLLTLITFYHLPISALGGSRGQHPLESAVHIDASGAVSSAARHIEDPGNWVDILKKAKDNFASTINTARLMRTQVRRHVPQAMEKAAGVAGHHVKEVSKETLLQAFTLLDSGEVNCSAMIEDTEPVTGKLCRILVGNNTQVAGKLERAVKGLSLRPKSADATEMAVADNVEDGLLTHLRSALWDMWFCAKRADPPCDPMTSGDRRVKAARERALDALRAIHTHAETPLAGVGPPVLQQTASQDSATTEVSALLQTEEKVRQTPVQPASAWADNVINNMLKPPGVTDKLYEAINNLDIDTNSQENIVRIEGDEDKSMKKLKADLLILHECASMPDCAIVPGTTCCTPKSPTQALYIQARDDAYVAYHNMEHDNDMAKAVYVDLLKNIAVPKKDTHKKTEKDEDEDDKDGVDEDFGNTTWSGKDEEEDEDFGDTTWNGPQEAVHEGPRIWGEMRHASDSSNEASHQTTSGAAAPGNNNALMGGIIFFGVVVLISIGFVAYKMTQLKREKAPPPLAGAESWEDEGANWQGGEGY